MHLNSETALDFIEGRLKQEERTFWTRHLEVCGDCSQEVGRWRQTAINLKRTHLESASEPDLAKVIEIFPPGPAPGVSRVRRILATITFDNFLQPALAGARGAAAASRQLVLRAENFDIHVKVWGEPGHRQMLGQLLPRSEDRFVQARFHLLRHSERLESTVVDEMGEFHFTDVPDDDLSLQVDLPNLTVIGALRIVD